MSRNLTVRSLTLLAILTCWTSVQARSEQVKRTWKDSTGKFKIEATLVDQTETHVVLKKADGREVKVPITRLSADDHKFLRSLSDEPESEPADPFAGGKQAPPQAEVTRKLSAGFAKSNSAAVGRKAPLPNEGQTVTLVEAEAPRGLQPDPAANVAPLPEGGFQVSKVDAYDRVPPPLVIDHEAGLVAVSISRNQVNKPEEIRGRIYLGQLPKGPADLVWDVAEAVRLLDHHAASGRTLIMSGLDHFERGGEIVLMEGLDKGKPNELYRRTLPGIDKPGFKPQIGWAQLLDAEHVVAQIDDKLFVWNLPTAELVYRIDKIDRGKHPSLSPGRKYLAIPANKGVSVVDVVDGSSLGYFSTGGLLTPTVDFQADGKTLALCDNNRFVVADILNGEYSTNAVLTRPLGSKQVGWVGENLFVSYLGDLIDTQLEMPVWSYAMSGTVVPRAIPGGVLLSTKSPQCNIVSLSVPHRAAVQAAKELQRGGDKLLLVRPGSKVSLAVEASEGVDREAVQNALGEAVRRTGWEVVDRADTTVVAIVGRGETKQLEYRTRVVGGGQAGVETASITPFTAKLEIRRGGQVLWTRDTINRPPSLIFSRNGESLQEAVKKYEKPDPEFFSRLQLPPRIPKPEIASGLGRSSLDGFSWKDYAAAPQALPRGRRSGR